MIQARNEGIILERTNLEFESQAVLNPGCIEKDGLVHMFYRAVRTGNFSTIGYCQLKDNKVVYRAKSPILFPEHEYEKHGLEDPRIVLLEGTYYLFYTAYDGQNSMAAYATSKDLIIFKKQGLISSKIAYGQAKNFFDNLRLKKKYLEFELFFEKSKGLDVLLWQKDTFIFPKKINNRYLLVLRVLPSIQVIYFDNFTQLNDSFWIEYFHEIGGYVMLDPEYAFESYNIGGGCPPIETPQGWLFIYHAVEHTDHGNVYHAAAALLDIDQPLKVLGRLPYPLFSPMESWELKGDVNNVVFPTGAIIKDDRLYVYYGAADKVIAAKSFDLDELLIELKSNPPQIKAK